jgi:uncharacterized membrane protein YdjX (TVP38/TMEM64 family)
VTPRWHRDDGTRPERRHPTIAPWSGAPAAAFLRHVIAELAGALRLRLRVRPSIDDIVLRAIVRDRRFWRFALFLAVVAMTGALALVRAGNRMPLTPNGMREVIAHWGVLGPVVFTGMFALRPFVFFPSTLLFLAGGLAFGVGWGTFYSAVGATIGGVIGFAVARWLGYDFVRAQLGDRLVEADANRWGAGLVFVLNLIPVVPITMINYGAGLSGMELLPFTLAVLVGITPRAFAYSFFGHSLLNVGSKQFTWSLALLVALVVLPLSIRYRLHRARARNAATTGIRSL